MSNFYSALDSTCFPIFCICPNQAAIVDPRFRSASLSLLASLVLGSVRLHLPSCDRKDDGGFIRPARCQPSRGPLQRGQGRGRGDRDSARALASARLRNSDASSPNFSVFFFFFGSSSKTSSSSNAGPPGVEPHLPRCAPRCRRRRRRRRRRLSAPRLQGGAREGDVDAPPLGGRRAPGLAALAPAAPRVLPAGALPGRALPVCRVRGALWEDRRREAAGAGRGGGRGGRAAVVLRRAQRRQRAGWQAAVRLLARGGTVGGAGLRRPRRREVGLRAGRPGGCCCCSPQKEDVKKKKKKKKKMKCVMVF